MFFELQYFPFLFSSGVVVYFVVNPLLQQFFRLGDWSGKDSLIHHVGHPGVDQFIKQNSCHLQLGGCSIVLRQSFFCVYSELLLVSIVCSHTTNQ